MLALLILALPACGGAKDAPQPATRFAVSSPAFADNTPIPVEYTCKGRNVPPPLSWQNPPGGTQTLALVVDDPDAPSGPYVHWVVSGIPASTTGIGQGLPDQASVGLNSNGKAEYFGPCPPAGTGVHHYRFQLYALAKPLALASTTAAQQATQTIANAAIAEARTVGTFGS